MRGNGELKHHYHPRAGWMNDPNGLCFFAGRYHAYYQHEPHHEYPWDGPMCWGHAVTRDFVTWEERRPAILPGEPYDAKGVWSGTAIEKDGVLYAYYASVGEDGRQTVSVASSRDGDVFEKYSGNPILTGYPKGRTNDFRDPAVYIEGGRAYLVVASGDTTNGTGCLLLYTGEDMLHWEFAGVMLEFEHSTACECPSFVKAGDEYLLSTSVMPIGGEPYFIAMCGSFDGRRFTPRVTSRFQKGPDQYAGQIFHAPDGRNILITWIPGWKYQSREKCVGCLSLPCEITVDGDIIRAYPVSEVRHLLDGNDTLTDAYVRERFVRGGEEVHTELIGIPKTED